MAPSRGGGSRGCKQTAQRGTSQASHKHKQKAAKPSSSSYSSSPSSSPQATPTTIPASLVQTLLDAFVAAFPHLLEPNAATNVLPGILQQVKHHLFERDFARAFGASKHLEAYAVRWSAARVAGYAAIFHEIFQKHCREWPQRLLCLGGGSGAELVGAEGARRLAAAQSSVDVATVDVADWSSVLKALHTSLISATEAGEKLTQTFYQRDLLSPVPPADGSFITDGTTTLDEPAIPAMSDESSTTDGTAVEDRPVKSTQALFKTAQVITLMFTLNELFSASLSKTQTLLLDLTASVQPGTLLLVVDSPGSYSTVQLAGREKQYPMAWMLNHVLLNVAADMDFPDEASRHSEGRSENTSEDIIENTKNVSKNSGPKWEKLIDEPSRWFRLPKSVEYPIELEDMRLQMYVYRRLGSATAGSTTH